MSYFLCDLRWNKYVDYITAKASRLLGFIKRNFRMAPPSLKETYFSHVRSVLDFASELWDPFIQNLLDHVEKVQNRAARFVAGNYDFRASITELKSSLNWMPLRQRRKLFRLKMLHKVFYNNSAISRFMYIFEPAYVSERRDNSRKIRPFHSRTDVFKCSFFPRSIKDWINLPSDVVEMALSELFFFSKSFIVSSSYRCALLLE